MASVADERVGTDWRELVAVVLLSVTAIATAWTGFQASKWGGAMSISFSQASSARIEASRQQTIANRMQTIQVGRYSQWFLLAVGGVGFIAATGLLLSFPKLV